MRSDNLSRAEKEVIQRMIDTMILKGEIGTNHISKALAKEGSQDGRIQMKTE